MSVPTQYSNLPRREPAPVAPHRATELFLYQSDVDRFDLDLDLDHARVVLCVLSHLLGKGRSKTRAQLHSGVYAIVHMMRSDLIRFGETSSAPYPDLPADGWPSGRSAFHQLDITHIDLEETWTTTKDRADDACLPVEWVLAFFPARLWAPVATLIGWGPDQLQVRMEDAVKEMARQPVTRQQRRRPAGSRLSKGTIENRITGVWQLLDAVIALRNYVATAPRPSLDLAIIDAWTRKPPRTNSRSLGARESGQDNSGPSIEAYAKRLRELARKARTGPPAYHKLRRRLVLSLLMFGPRVDALRTVRVEDYLPAFRFSDGTTGPALRIYPGKSWDRDEPHYLPLPPLMAEWIAQWITFTGRAVEQLDEPLFPSLNPTTATKPYTYLSQAAFYSTIAGNTKGQWGCHALLPTGQDPHVGWRPHAFRHTAYQLAIRAAIAYQVDHPDDYPHVHPEEFAKAVVAHKLGGTVSATYRDLNRDTLSVAIVPYMWKIVFDDGAVRHGADPARIKAARGHLGALKATISALRTSLAGNEQEAQSLGKRAQKAKDTHRQLALYAKASHLSDTARGQRDTLAALERDLEAAQIELTLAQDTLIPLADDLTDTDYQALIAAALGTPITPTAEPTVELADEITIADAAELWDTTPQAINRWIRDGSPKNRPPAWHDDAWHFYSKKDKRLTVARIHTDHLSPQQLQRLHHLQEQRSKTHRA